MDEINWDDYEYLTLGPGVELPPDEWREIGHSVARSIWCRPKSKVKENPPAVVGDWLYTSIFNESGDRDIIPRMTTLGWKFVGSALGPKGTRREFIFRRGRELPVAEPKHEKWEYMKKYVMYPVRDVEQFNEFGEQGWEYAGVANGGFMFKRPRTEG